MPRKIADPEELRQLAEVFRLHGADEPESWALSQLEEGIPQLAIFCFLKALWQGIVPEDGVDWFEGEIEWAKSRPNDPCAQLGPALEEMLAKGVRREAIIDLIRVMQYNSLYNACLLIDGAMRMDLPVNDWTLHQVDEEGRPVATIQGLHEVMLSMDPTGREMRPRPT
jgi:hypothetical protein